MYHNLLQYHKMLKNKNIAKFAIIIHCVPIETRWLYCVECPQYSTCGYLDPPYAVTSPHSTRLLLLSESAVDLPIIGWIHQLKPAVTAALGGCYVDR